MVNERDDEVARHDALVVVVDGRIGEEEGDGRERAETTSINKTTAVVVARTEELDIIIIVRLLVSSYIEWIMF